MASTTSLTRTAREYLRVSADKSGRLRSPAEQHDDNERAAGSEGFTLGASYRETGAVSASKYGKKMREAFALLLADLEGGTFGADILVLWESSRGSRKVSEWAHLAEAMEDAGVVVYVTSHGRFYDPANGRDRRTLMDDANDSEYAAWKISEGVQRAMTANAKDGKPHGHTPYGYRRVYEDRKLIGQVIVPDEAAIVRELYRRLNAGESLRSLEKDLAARGILTRQGKAFSAFAIRSMVLHPCYMAKRIHSPERSRGKVDPETLTDATWDEIVDVATWWQVHDRLTDPARRTTKPGTAKHLLSILARCGVCGGPMTATFRYKSSKGAKTVRAWQLVCQRSSHTRIMECDLDEYVTGEVIEYLSRPENYVSGAADTGELARVKGEIAELNQRRENLALALAEGMDAVQVAKSDKIIAAKLADLEGMERQIATPAALSGLVGPSNRAEDIRARWGAAPVSARREIIRLVMQDVGTLHVNRHPGHTNIVPASERVEWRQPVEA